MAEAIDYLSTGGLGEVVQLAELNRDLGHEKVQMDGPMAMALLILAAEGLAARQKPSLN